MGSARHPLDMEDELEYELLPNRKIKIKGEMEGLHVTPFVQSFHLGFIQPALTEVTYN